MTQLIITPPSTPSPPPQVPIEDTELTQKGNELSKELSSLDQERCKKYWWDPLIIVAAFLFVSAVRLYALLWRIYVVHLWPIKFQLTKLWLNMSKGNKEAFQAYGKIPKHLAIYTSRGHPHRVDLSRLLRKCQEFKVDENQRIDFLTIIIDNDIDLEEYIIVPDGIDLYYQYEPFQANMSARDMKVNIVRKDGCQRVSNILSSTVPRPSDVPTMLPLISPIFPPIDLILVLHPELILQGCMPFHISFSEIMHYPCPNADLFLGILEQAVYDYAHCKQNFGK